MNNLKTYKQRHQELAAQNALLGDLFLVSPTNRAGIAREEQAERQAVDQLARQRQLEALRSLEAQGFRNLAHLESLRLHGHGLEADIYERANAVALRDERDRLTAINQPEPPEAA